MAQGWARDLSRARHRHVVGQGAADRRRPARRRRSLRAARACRARIRCGASRTRTTGSRASRPRSRRSAAMRRRTSPRSPASASPARCTARPCSTRDDKPLRPAILWNDGRSFAECAELKRRVPDFEKRTGNLAMPGFTAPKMLWVAAHEPEIATATKRVLLPKDYVRLRALRRGGVGNVGRLRHALARRRPSGAGTRTCSRRPAFARSDADAWSRARRSRPISRPRSPTAWGLAGRRIPIAGGGGDNAASAVGVGATAPGEGFVSLGTSGVVFSVTDRYVSLPERTLHAFCHALPHRWHGMSVMLSAASSLSWIAGVLGREHDIGELVADARSLRPIEERGRLRADLPALSQRRAHAAQRRGGDGHVRRACAPSTAPTRWSSR